MEARITKIAKEEKISKKRGRYIEIEYPFHPPLFPYKQVQGVPQLSKPQDAAGCMVLQQLLAKVSKRFGTLSRLSISTILVASPVSLQVSEFQPIKSKLTQKEGKKRFFFFKKKDKLFNIILLCFKLLGSQFVW